MLSQIVAYWRGKERRRTDICETQGPGSMRMQPNKSGLNASNNESKSLLKALEHLKGI